MMFLLFKRNKNFRCNTQESLSLAHVFEEEQLSFYMFLTNHIVILLYKKELLVF